MSHIGSHGVYFFINPVGNVYKLSGFKKRMRNLNFPNFFYIINPDLITLDQVRYVLLDFYL